MADNRPSGSAPALPGHGRRNQTFNRFLIVLLGVWLLLVLVNTQRPKDDLRIVALANRKGAAVTRFPLLGGGVWNLNEHRGKVVLVNLWATWCPPCHAETPALVRLAGEFKGDGLDVLGVSLDEGDAAPIRRFVHDFGIPYPIARGDRERSFSLGVPVPVTRVYDRRGRLALETLGHIDERVLRSRLRTLLDEPRH